MNILGFNPSHHGSVCLLQDGELKYFIQEERIGNRKKYTGLPFKSFIDVLQNYKLDFITWGTPSIEYNISNKTTSLFPYWQSLAWSYHSEIRYYDFSPDFHHQLHAAHSFYNSGFKKCIGVIIDGCGSDVKLATDQNSPRTFVGQETETIFECSYPFNFNVLFKNIFSSRAIPNLMFDEDLDSNARIHVPVPPKNVSITNHINLSRVYETVTMYLGWSRNEAGKTMGLAPYGKFNPTLPPFFQNKNGNPNVFFEDLKKHNDPGSVPRAGEFLDSFINYKTNPQLKLQNDPKEWHYDESKITDLEKDLAWKIQNDTQQLVGDYIEIAIEKTGLKQVCCAGGYFLNCVTNYYLVKRFPDIEFYFEPISNDAGTSIGAAKLVWHEKTQDTTIRPFKSLYLGKQYSKDELLKGIKKYT